MTSHLNRRLVTFCSRLRTQLRNIRTLLHVSLGNLLTLEWLMW